VFLCNFRYMGALSEFSVDLNPKHSHVIGRNFAYLSDLERCGHIKLLGPLGEVYQFVLLRRELGSVFAGL
jgi:hypothetical protein